MLGRLQMDVDECISAYNDLIKLVFNEKARVHQSNFSLLGQTQARFDSGGLKAAIEKTLKDRGLSPTDSMVDSREPNCKVSVSATICQAARATSAATIFFNPVSIEGMKFVDGALGVNNPVDQVEEEATEIWCPNTANLQPLVKCFISIGTGRLPAYNIDDRVDKFIDCGDEGVQKEKRNSGRHRQVSGQSSPKFLDTEMRSEPATEEEECSPGFGTFDCATTIFRVFNPRPAEISYEALSILEKTIPIQEGNLGKSHPDTLISRSHLANEYLATKELTKAISVLEELVPLQRKTLAQMNKETMFSENQLAEAYFNNQNVYTAVKLYEHMCLVRQNLDQSDEQRKWAEAGYQKCAETWKWTWMRR
ncbi:calcium-independent phospholipase A2 [Fusarium coicis]|nr:calcium-independent phospholipase A2 [Fusarium coicis]